MITEYNQFCLLCGSPAVDIHHCLKGVSKRHLADKDGLVIPVCRKCHEEIHHGYKALNIAVEIIGQLQYEKHYIAEKRELPFENIEEEAREAFRSRYSRSYI